jgi:hypothetical protein
VLQVLLLAVLAHLLACLALPAFARRLSPSPAACSGMLPPAPAATAAGQLVSGGGSKNAGYQGSPAAGCLGGRRVMKVDRGTVLSHGAIHPPAGLHCGLRTLLLPSTHQRSLPCTCDRSSPPAAIASLHQRSLLSIRGPAGESTASVTCDRSLRLLPDEKRA